MVEFIKIVASYWGQIWDFFFPRRYYCWQTLVWLTLFSTIVSALATGATREFISTLGYGFLIFGFTWIGAENRFPLTPWITSAAILHLCSGLLVGVSLSLWLVLWLPLAAIIKGLPIFFDRYLEFSLPNYQQRQNFLVLFGSQVLMACWLQFAVTIDRWLEDYPSLLADDFSQSLIVVQLPGRQSEAAPETRSQTILTALRPLLEAELSGRDWPPLQSAFASNTWGSANLPDLRRRALTQLAANPYENLPENELWQLGAQSQPEGNGYRLTVVTQWQGPRSRDRDAAAAPGQNPDRDALICRVEPRPVPGNLAVNQSTVTCQTTAEQGEFIPAPEL